MFLEQHSYLQLYHQAVQHITMMPSRGLHALRGIAPRVAHVHSRSVRPHEITRHR